MENYELKKKTAQERLVMLQEDLKRIQAKIEREEQLIKTCGEKLAEEKK